MLVEEKRGRRRGFRSSAANRSNCKSHTWAHLWGVTDLVRVRVSESITKEIVTSLYTADLVVADLTGHNPNVFYELGLAHSAGTPTVMITQEIDELPFDLNTYRVHPYEATDKGLRELSEYVSTTIWETIANPDRITNPVVDFAPIQHADVILQLDDVLTIEFNVKHEVCLLQPTIDTDLTLFIDVIKRNIFERDIQYRYIIPKTPTTRRQWARFIDAVAPSKEDSLQARTVEPHQIESEVVLYDLYTENEDILLMSPRENQTVFWYRVGQTRGETIRERFETLWESHTESL